VSFGSSVSTASLIWTFWKATPELDFRRLPGRPLVLGWNVDFHAVDRDEVDGFRRRNQYFQIDGEEQLLDREHGRAGAVAAESHRDSLGLHGDDRAASVPQQDLDGRHLRAVDVQRSDFHLAVEAICMYLMACARNSGSNRLAITEAAI
jgi:hypothetical protein